MGRASAHDVIDLHGGTRGATLIQSRCVTDAQVTLSDMVQFMHNALY
jgi:hypothetical protein